jgi:hypothetical protein
MGVEISRLLPYAMQLVVLSAFFDAVPRPTPSQYDLLKRWFWVSSFSGWFGGANPSRVNSLVAEFRGLAGKNVPNKLGNFNLEAPALPYPSSFDMRSARTRSLLLVMLSLKPRNPDGSLISEPWLEIAKKGPSAVGHILGDISKEFSGNPANRMIRPPSAARGVLGQWIRQELANSKDEVLASHGFSAESVGFLIARDIRGFISSRQEVLIAAERRFQESVSVNGSSIAVGDSPVDTD